MNCEGKTNVNNKNCKCCGTYVEGLPCLSYKNMPGRAQNFPNNKELKFDIGIDVDIYQCPSCGLIQLFSKPVDYYKDVIRAISVSDDMKMFRKEYFNEFIVNCGLQGKRVIEIGAGCGEYMELLLAEDVQVYGLEHLQASVESAQKKGLTVYQGFVEDSKTEIQGSPYDGFLIMNFLEHVPNPKEFLRGIAANIKDEAYGLIEVPNGDYIIQNQIFSEFMLDHLCYFTQESLKNILNICGFEVIECKVIWNDYIISAVVKKRNKFDATIFEKKKNKFICSINTYIEKMKKKGKKVAVWGAGHQALAIIALANLQGKIECVFDSASFKQNRYTPATHIPIYAPDKINELGIEAILIIAGSYSEEVYNLIREVYKDVDAITLKSLEEEYHEEN